MILADGLRAGKGGFDAPRSDSDGGGGESGYVDTPRWAPVRRYDFGKEKKKHVLFGQRPKRRGCMGLYRVLGASFFLVFFFFLPENSSWGAWW